MGWYYDSFYIPLLLTGFEFNDVNRFLWHKSILSPLNDLKNQ